MPPQYSQRPEASGVVVAHSKGARSRCRGRGGGDGRGGIRRDDGCSLARRCARIAQRRADFLRNAIGLAVFNGIAMLDAVVVHPERDAFVIGKIYVDGEILRRSRCRNAKHVGALAVRNRSSAAPFFVSRIYRCRSRFTWEKSARRDWCCATACSWQLGSAPHSSSATFVPKPSVRVGLNAATRSAFCSRHASWSRIWLTLESRRSLNHGDSFAAQSLHRLPSSSTVF